MLLPDLRQALAAALPGPAADALCLPRLGARERGRLIGRAGHHASGPPLPALGLDHALFPEAVPLRLVRIGCPDHGDAEPRPVGEV